MTGIGGPPAQLLMTLLNVVALWVVVILTLLSGGDYFWRFWRQVVRAPGKGTSAEPQPEGEKGP